MSIAIKSTKHFTEIKTNFEPTKKNFAVTKTSESQSAQARISQQVKQITYKSQQ